MKWKRSESRNTLTVPWDETALPPQLTTRREVFHECRFVTMLVSHVQFCKVFSIRRKFSFFLRAFKRPIPLFLSIAGRLRRLCLQSHHCSGGRSRSRARLVEDDCVSATCVNTHLPVRARKIKDDMRKAGGGHCAPNHRK